MTKVLVLYNQPVLPVGHSDYESEHEILDTVEHVGRYLIEAGLQVTRLGVSHDPGVLLAGLREHRPDVVFNLFEGTADRGDTEAYVAGLLEWLRVPFTGSPSQAIYLARRKHLTKALFQGAGLPTAPFVVVDSLPIPDCRLKWPVIVKPAEQDASVGLDQGSVVTSQRELSVRVALLLERYGPPVLVEEFIRGREFNVAIVTVPQLRVLPISEIVFAEQGPDFWPIVTYDAKWKVGSREDLATQPRCPAEISPRLTQQVEDLACKAFHLLGCRDYARVDFRVGPTGKPYVLEVNPNPDFSPSAGLAQNLAAGGVGHGEFAVALVKARSLAASMFSDASEKRA